MRRVELPARVERDPARDSAYISIADGIRSERRVRLDADSSTEGMQIDFDGGGHFAGLLVTEASRRFPAESQLAAWPLRLASGSAYLDLAERRAGYSHSAAFGEEENRPAWGINLDFDRQGRLIGIEFESAAEHLPPALLNS